MNRVKDKVAIITAGGGRGIGRATALLLSKEGARIVINDKNEVGGEETKSMILSHGGEAIFVHGDATNKKDIKELVTTAIESYGQIDILVNNVGGAKGLMLLDDTFEDDMDFNLKTSLMGPILCTREVLPYMIERKKGSVVFISATNVLLGGYSETPYAVAKGGLHPLVRTLASDYPPIRFNAICPCNIDTHSKTWEDREKEIPGLMQKLGKLYPIGRVGQPDDIAYGILYLASEESSWTTGQILIIDGGITASGNLPGGEWWKKI